MVYESAASGHLFTICVRFADDGGVDVGIRPYEETGSHASVSTGSE